MKNTDSEKNIYEKWHQDPENWKWGVFYFNKKDKRLLVPKKIKYLGWTINFANAKSVLFFLISLLFFLVVFSLIEKYN